MKSFNLSDWSLGHRSLVWYFMIAFIAAGLFSYLQLGRQEDPDFTIKAMVIKALWPGAAAEEITREVTDRIEKKLEELESLDYTKSVTVAGQTTVFVYLRDSTKASDVVLDAKSRNFPMMAQSGMSFEGLSMEMCCSASTNACDDKSMNSTNIRSRRACSWVRRRVSS